MKNLIEKLRDERMLSCDEFITVLSGGNEHLHEESRKACQRVYGDKIFMRGLIEFTSHCAKDCYYCGLRRSNKNAKRYRLTTEQILESCKQGYELGFRTYVLQGGEDAYYTDEILVEIITRIRENHPECAITLSIGERSYESLKRLYEAGADRYLLRHETANPHHYEAIHPAGMTLASRKECLYNIKKIGYQVGCGFMIGSPNQSIEHIVDDLLFIKELDPEMVGIGPFIPHKDTPYANEKAGDLNLTLNTLAVLRLMKPNLLLPATTALGTVDKQGRERGVLAGANVVMPNLSPMEARSKYLLYDNKICTSDTSAHCRGCIDRRMNSIGRRIVVSRGDYVAV